jgi:hypothetical protein
MQASEATFPALVRGEVPSALCPDQLWGKTSSRPTYRGTYTILLDFGIMSVDDTVHMNLLHI